MNTLRERQKAVIGRQCTRFLVCRQEFWSMEGATRPNMKDRIRGRKTYEMLCVRIGKCR